jgi:hypothetical protein
MAKNEGYKIEGKTVKEILDKKTVTWQKLNGTQKSFNIDPMVLVPGKSTRNKTDLIINSNCRVQIKSTSTNRACIVNMVPKRNLLKMSKRELLDVQPAIDILNKLINGTIKNGIKLSTIANKEDFREILQYLLFEGTPTSQEIPALQANYLLDIDSKKATLIEKTEAIDFLWDKLTAEIRTRKARPQEPCLHIRYKA